MHLCDLQYLKSRNLVLENLLGLVEVSQYDLRFSVMNGVHLPQVPLVPLCKVLFMGSAAVADVNAASGQQVTSAGHLLPRSHSALHVCTLIKATYVPLGAFSLPHPLNLLVEIHDTDATFHLIIEEDNRIRMQTEPS